MSNSTHGISTGKHQYLIFCVADSEYGIDILRVQEIRGSSTLTTLAGAASHVLGVLTVRDIVVPIVSLRRRLGLSDAQRVATPVIIIVRSESADGCSRVLGLLIDGVTDVCHIEPGSLKPPLQLGAGSDSGFTRGFATAADNKLLIMLDVDRLIDSDGVYATVKRAAA